VKSSKGRQCVNEPRAAKNARHENGDVVSNNNSKKDIDGSPPLERKRESCGRYDSDPLSEWSEIGSGPLFKDISMMIRAQIKSAVIIV